MYQVWLKLAQWFLKRFQNFYSVFLVLCNCLSLEKGGGGLSFVQTVPSLVEIGPVVLEKKIF